MKALPPPLADDAQRASLPDRRAAARATPGQPFGRRAVDQTILSQTYPAAFVAQIAAASLARADARLPVALNLRAGSAAPVKGPGYTEQPNPYRRAAPLGIVAKTKA
jgi:hypothetical protein